MKKHRNIIFIVLGVIVLIGVSIGIYILLSDENKLTVDERSWINENISTIQNVNIINNVNVFGKNGSGVFYDFLLSFEESYDLTINRITYSTSTTNTGITLGYKTSISDNDLIFYKDHFVLISKNDEVISSLDAINGNVGILTSYTSYVSTYINNTDISLVEYETADELFESTEVEFIIVPLIEYLDIILSNDYNILFHFSDITLYYTLTLDDSILSSILEKYFNTWTDELDDSINENLFNTFKSSLSITDTEVDSIRSITYNYGFVNASPYEVIFGGSYGGIIAVALSNFSDFSGVEFNYTKYKNYEKFANAIENGKIDIYFNYYNYTDNYYDATGLNIEYSVIARRSNTKVVNSIYSLVNETVYVPENSKIYDYVKSIDGINIETYSTMDELFKLNSKDVYIILDSNTFLYYSTKKLDNYTERYTSYIDNQYTFKLSENTTLYKLLDKYMSFIDSNELIYDGVNNHYNTMRSGTFLSSIAQYILIGVLILAVIILIIIRRGRKISVAKKIRKEDKMKFIDQLTSLKNRNFLNENILTWNNNVIYPQTLLVIDLNKVQEINDQYGYNEGDKQIKAMANILIKTQLDNSEVIRTDGNEFVVYLVGYNQKQVSNYIHKLQREIKKLPYEYGAEFGYSVIEDDIKTVEDAMNEAVEDVKIGKEKNEES